MAQKHVVHVVLNLDIGGLEKVLVNCIQRLDASSYSHTQSHTYSHTIVALKSYSEAFKGLLPSHVKVVAFNKQEGNDLSLFSKFYHLLRAEKPDVVHTYNLSTLELQTIAWFCRVPVRLHAEHGRDIFDPNGTNKKYRLLRKLIFPLVHKVVAVSADLFNWLRDDVGINENKLAFVPNGIDTEHFVPRQVTAEPASSSAFHFGHVGRLAPIKNQQLMIRAFASACEKDANFANNAKLLIVGDGECRDELAKVIQETQTDAAPNQAASAQANVVLVGAKLDMLTEYHKFDVFVMSSLAEGIPMTLLESMSCAIPPVVTSVGGIPEVVTEQSGYLYPSQDQQKLTELMLTLFRDQTLTKTLGANARQRIIDQYSEVAMVDAYSSLYSGT